MRYGAPNRTPRARSADNGIFGLRAFQLFRLNAITSARMEHLMSSPVILINAPNGARRLKVDHPAIPLAPDEIAREAAKARDAGAAMIHLHVRDRAGGHLLDADAYREASAAIHREAGADMLVQITTEAVGIYAPQAQMAVVEVARPEAFSVALRELLPEDADERAAAAFLAREARLGTLVQHILYDSADLVRFQALVARGVIPTRHASVLFVLGRYVAGQQSSPRDLVPILAGYTLALPFALCAFGRQEAACVTAAMACGGHARVGFENNLDLPDGTRAPDNAALVAAAAAGARAIGLRPATPDEARAIFTAC